MPRHGPPGDPHGSLGLLSALFPHDPSYEGLLSLERINALKGMSLARAGLGIMGASAPQPGGPQPLPAAIAQNLGGALAEWPQILEGAATGAGRIASFNREQETIRRRREIMEQTPQRAGEDDIGWLRRLYPQFLKSGDLEVVGKLTELLKSVGGEGPARLTEVDTGPGGESLLVNPFTGEPVRRFPNVPAPSRGPTGRGALKQIPGPTGPEWAVFNPATQDFEPTGQPALTTEAQARANVQAPLARRSLERLRGRLSPDRITQIVAEKGWNEFLRANAEKLQRNIRIIADAYARTLTGAAMREEEWDNAKKVMAPQAGDDPETVREKLEDVEILVEQLDRIAGRLAPVPKENRLRSLLPRRP